MADRQLIPGSAAANPDFRGSVRAEDKLIVAEPERIGGPALDQRNGLQRLDRRAGEHWSLDLAERQHEAPLGVGNSDRAGMAALDEGPSHHLDEHGIGRIGFTHAWY